MGQREILSIENETLKASKGHKDSQEILLKYMLSQYGKRYRDPDCQQVFLIGVWKALDKVRLDIGNPLKYLNYKGHYAVIDYVKQRMKKNLRQHCQDCRLSSRLYRNGFGKYICTACQSEQIYIMNYISPTDLLEPHSHDDNNLVIWEFRNQLAGRQLNVFELALSGHKQIEIAAILRITTTNVSIRMRQIRSKWLKYQNQ
ncbi:MAG TPA: hypothetical protein VGE40_11280 [Bacilli bacterium]